MKRFFIFIALTLALVNISYAQSDVTKFMGIPVDGSKAEVVSQLIKKGSNMMIHKIIGLD